MTAIANTPESREPVRVNEYDYAGLKMQAMNDFGIPFEELAIDEALGLLAASALQHEIADEPLRLRDEDDHVLVDHSARTHAQTRALDIRAVTAAGPNPWEGAEVNGIRIEITKLKPLWRMLLHVPPKVIGRVAFTPPTPRAPSD